MLFVGLLVVVALVVTWVYGILDVATADASAVRLLPQKVWLAVVVVGLSLGAVAWLLLGRPARATPPDPDRGQAPPVGPDDDADFQAKLRDRVREQRRRAEEQRRRREQD